MNRTVNQYLQDNWTTIRSDLAQDGNHTNVVPTRNAIGEGIYNEGMYGAGPRSAEYDVTSMMEIRLWLVPAFPTGRGSSAWISRVCPPGGESMMDVADRLRAFFADVSARFADRRVLVVAHDAVVLMLRHVVEGLSVPQLQGVVAAGPVRNASVTRWVRDAGGLRLAGYNMVPAPVGAGER